MRPARFFTSDGLIAAASTATIAQPSGMAGAGTSRNCSFDSSPNESKRIACMDENFTSALLPPSMCSSRTRPALDRREHVLPARGRIAQLTHPRHEVGVGLHAPHLGAEAGLRIAQDRLDELHVGLAIRLLGEVDLRRL